MSRKEIQRIVHEPPLFSAFKPYGVHTGDLGEIQLTLDEFEALRLADQIGLSQEEAAEEMEISRPTFSRLIEKARNKMAEFIIGGKVLTIGGGTIHFRSNLIRCRNCGHMFKTSFEGTATACPACGSANLQNLAGGFGHGRCCGNRHQNKNRNQ